MKTKENILIGAVALLAGSLFAADSGPKDEVVAAAKKLGEQPNYSWHTKVVVPEGQQFRPGPTDGKVEKGGFIHFTSTFGDNTSQTVIKGDKSAVTNMEGAWQSVAELENEEGFRRFRAIMVRNFKAPAEQAAQLANGIKELKKEGDVYSGDLTEEGVKAFMTFGRRAGGDGPTVSNPKGSAKFWVKDGMLSKYEFHVKGAVSFNGNDIDIDRTTTVEIKDVGNTKVDVPEEAKKKLG